MSPPPHDNRVRSQGQREAARSRARRFRNRRRVALLITLAVGLLAVLGISRLSGGEENGAAEEAQSAQLPGGGRSVLPERRVVAFYGSPGAPELGALGVGNPTTASARLKKQADAYKEENRPVLPAFELISTLVLSEPGEDGLYRRRLPDNEIQRYLDVAREVDALLLLDIQPGRADFLSEVKALEPFLKEPDVGIALDPEWRMGPEEIPGDVIGHVEASEVNAVSDYLSKLVASEDLPDKLMVIHQFTADMIRDKDTLEPRQGLDIVPNADGVGAEPLKRAKYEELAPPSGGPFFRGFKLFYEEDPGLMSPGRVLDLKPGPVDFVVYE